MKLLKTLTFSAAVCLAVNTFSAGEEYTGAGGWRASRLPTATGITDTGLARLKAILDRQADGNQSIGGAPAGGSVADGNRATLLEHEDGSNGAAGGAGQNVVACPDVSGARTLEELVALLNAALDD